MANLRNLVAGVLVLVGLAFAAVGCGQLYKLAGLPPEKVDELTAEDQAVTVELIREGREQLWQIATLVVAGVGTIVSGLLAKWLGVERKINRAVIAGVEQAEDGNAKAAIKQQATVAGVQEVLHKRVKALGG